ncbi:hypothetical protein I6F35_20150 [Bradyrhizobium sp. BRP22]|uniref:hypothetical protein n=1 Tax=Bradyrhizobium sp. BRP22 TaxID=2793821 RepID=UPI001CD6CD0A|nr:hypothetical protein [Bradyrhizobium sp. BRP22]MCA1455494.1 hypothetical protein [Bradyrhizobium sp. BRP22]
MASRAEFLRALIPYPRRWMAASSAYIDGALNHGQPTLRIARERGILTQVSRPSPDFGELLQGCLIRLSADGKSGHAKAAASFS